MMLSQEEETPKLIDQAVELLEKFAVGNSPGKAGEGSITFRRSQPSAASSQEQFFPESTMCVKSYRDLVVWQKFMERVEEVYLLTSSYPKREEYGLKSQTRGAASQKFPVQ